MKNYLQGWGAGAGDGRVFLAPWSRSRSKKTGAGNGAAWKKKSGAGAAKKISRLLSPAGR